MGRSPCCSKEGMNRGAWTQAEDKILTDYIKLHGEGRWRNVPKEAGLKRCGKSCRLRWMNYLRPDIKRGNISPDEEDLIIRLHKLLGNRWSLIAGRLPGRTDNEIKNYWNTNLSKREQGKERRPKLNQAKADKKPVEKKMDENSNSSDVIRTKASRCKEVFITLDDNQQHRTENRAINLTTPPSMDANLQHYNNNNSNIQAESTESSDGSLITLPFYKEENLDFMVDVIAADENIGVSDLLASDFTNLSHGLEISTSEMDNVIRGEEHAFLLPVEMEQKWSSGSNYIQADYESDSAFVSLVAFLELTEEWLI